ncbi:MAG: carboxylesterase/lipase family protein [Lachnospiraceae bacterium]|nr:carboxylesterase/lipase family protein [Lachnospiraceae bacterium]
MAKEFYMTKDAPIVETKAGKLRGFHYDGVDHFYGIRYAKAKRFQMPEPVAPWEGVKDAGSYGMICPVLSEPMPTGEVRCPHRFWPSSEHCQYLNVWTDSCDPAAKKPVMFWMHGGGYSAGSSIEQVCYDGFNLAKLDGVVVVSVNHRLNAFGYLDMSSFGEKYWNSVNVGMADLVEALRWVKANIAAFGGDPENVTIFGQSGGGGKVTVLGQIPEAEGLFQRMIVMSGVLSDLDFFGATTNATGREVALKVLAALNIPEDQVERLEKVPVPQFIWAVNKATKELRKEGKGVSWEPLPNAYYTGDPIATEFSESAKKIPTMVGSVFAEFAMPGPVKGAKDDLSVSEREAYVKGYFGEEGGEKILAEYRKQFPGKNEVYAIDYDNAFLPGTVKYVKAKAKVASAPVYNYFFTKIFNNDGGEAAWHCSDIPYFFHNAELIPLCHQPNYEYLDRAMSSYFVNFAKTGDPNGEGLVKWEPSTGDTLKTMILDDECRMAENLHDQLIPLLKQYKPKFSFDFGALSDDEDEESGNAWVF